MKDLKMKTGYWDSEFTMKLRKKSEGTICIKSSKREYAGTNNYYSDIVITTDCDEVKLNCSGAINTRHSLGEFFLAQVINNGLMAEVEEVCDGDWIIYYRKMPKRIETVVGKLKSLSSTDTDLSYSCITNINSDVIQIEYDGHYTGGSSIKEHDIAPSYIRALELECNRRAEWTSYDYGVNDRHVYKFNIYMNRIIDKEVEKKKYKGDVIRIEGYYPWRSNVSEKWAYMYAIAYHCVIENGSINGIEITDNNVFLYKGKEIFEMLCVEKEHNRTFGGNNCSSHRTHYKGFFDCYIDDRDMQKIFFEIFANENNVTDVKIRYSEYSSSSISFRFEGSTKPNSIRHGDTIKLDRSDYRIL